VQQPLETALRFTSPIPSGSRLRARASISGVDVSPRGLRLTLDVVGETEGSERPACRASAVILVQRSA
jgi:acyl dehydratase